MTPDRFDYLRALSSDWAVSGRRLSEALDEIARLSADVYIPGNWYCPKCGFEVVHSILHAQSGNVSVDRRHPEPCPNDGVALLPNTWRRDSTKMAERMPDANCMSYINALREGEGSSVTINSDNADFNGLPNCCVEVCDDWTSWEPKEYRADTLIQALALADAARIEWHESQRKPAK